MSGTTDTMLDAVTIERRYDGPEATATAATPADGSPRPDRSGAARPQPR
jgi:hypothetical protein